MQENFSLQAYNTFGIDAKARYFKQLKVLEELAQLHELPSFKTNRLILGGGSNILLTKDFDGLVLYNNLKGIDLVKENNTYVFLKVAAGEIWHELVVYAIEKEYGGLENLSLIPGRVGATPMQNIGAYGVELKDVFEELEAWNIDKEQFEIFDAAQCQFAYRESVFKHMYKGKYIIVSVTFKLTKNPQIDVSYGAIEQTLKARGIQNPGIKEVSDAVITIRSSKLPNPAEIGNAGSFFKNPVISNKLVQSLQEQYPNMPNYPIDASTTKIPAAWLIEQAGWKGKSFGNYGVDKNQALVLVNYGGAKGTDIIQLAHDIQKDIQAKFGIEISPEVNFI
jgi:UDP-N-acetylmuramate dehydrogenase